MNGRSSVAMILAAAVVVAGGCAPRAAGAPAGAVTPLAAAGANPTRLEPAEQIVVGVARQIITTGRVQHAFVGISYADITPEIAAQFRLPVAQGVIVIEVVPDSPAAQAGIQVQDIVTEIGGVAVERGGDLRRVLRASQPGETVTIGVLRPTGPATVTVRLGAAPG